MESKYAIKNPGGRPRIYDSEEELIEMVNKYFESLEADEERPTLTGLALFLGMASRQSLYDYEKEGRFSYIIKAARSRVEYAHEMNLYESGCAGSIFALKNMGWSDKQEHEHSGELGITWNEVRKYGTNAETNTSD